MRPDVFALYTLAQLSTAGLLLASTPCEKLTELTIPNVAITSAAMATAAPGDEKLPSFCRVSAIATPVPDSEIRFEVWIPSEWNGKFQGVGNGGYSGALSYTAMARALRAGYATASHNTGHTGDGMTFGQGHPEKIRDYAYRAVHVMTENAALVLHAKTGRFADKSYFVGCSAGGHQALSEAQRFPADYDGIIAGAPANNRIRQTFAFNWGWRALHRDDGTPITTAAKLAEVSQAIIESCDAVDGLKDGLIDDPRSCTEPDLSRILTAEELDAVRKVWGGAKGVFAGWPMGSENVAGQGWAQYLLTPAEPMRSDLFRFFLFHNPGWDWRSLDWANGGWRRDLAFADERLGFLNAVDTNLEAFGKRGGKLLLYAGWADPVVPPGDTVAYYDGVNRTTAGATDSVRLFLLPGMGHCGGGLGPSQFDPVSVLDRWVTQGVAPERLIASRAGRTRPVCVYPKVARYIGSGSIDDASNFECRSR